MQAPLILVTTSDAGQATKYGLRSSYSEAIYKSGGLPMAVFPNPADACKVEDLLLRADGVLLTGGDDLHPLLFGQQPRAGIGAVSRRRDDFEIALVRAAIWAGLPVLGICRGMQVINVAFGGTLLQDISLLTEDRGILHEQTAPRNTEWHSVDIEPRSRLAQIYAHLLENGRTLLVNSIHHQAVAKVAEGWKPTAAAPDNIIEGIEIEKNSFAIGVQWHPEEMPGHSAIFDAFVEAARVRKS